MGDITETARQLARCGKCFKQTIRVPRPQYTGWGVERAYLSRNVRGSLSRELTFRLSINTEEPAMGEADTAFQAEGTAYVKALR